MFSQQCVCSLHLSGGEDRSSADSRKALSASWEEGEILRGRVLRKALIIILSFEPSCATLLLRHGTGAQMLQVGWVWVGGGCV